MTDTEKLGLAALVIVGFTVWRKTKSLGNVVFLPGNVVGLSMSGSSPVIQVALIAQNTSNDNLLIQSLAGNVLADKTLIGNIASFSTQSIPANSQTQILVNLTLYDLGIVNILIGVMQNKNAVQDITVNGYANIGFAQVPINLTFKLGL